VLVSRTWEPQQECGEIFRAYRSVVYRRPIYYGGAFTKQKWLAALKYIGNP
jgi:hypothetical protein